MADQDSPLWEKLGMDHDLSPTWTLINMAKAIKIGLFILPQEQHTIERNKAFQMVNNRATYHRQSWIPDTPACKRAVLIPNEKAGNHPVPTIIDEHELYFNPSIISLMFTQDPERCTTWDVCQSV